MPNIKLYTSNMLEILIDRLADTTRTPLSSPFKPEVIVTQSKDMERWISMQLAERLGIWSNFRYFFPNQIITEIFGKVIPGFSAERFFDTETAAWQIMKLLPQCLPEKEFESLKDYLADDEQRLRSFQLSSRIADTFDQYLTYRPEMILAWDNGEGNDWQAKLWRLLKKEIRSHHPPELRKEFLERIKNPAGIDINSLPERIAVFGISSLPEYHLDILAAMSEYIDVNIFFMNPCREYWADIYTEKNIAKTLAKYEDDFSTEDLHLEKGNSLLASMGKVGGDFLSIVMKYGDVQEYTDFADQGRESLLCSIQSGILNMSEKDASGKDGGVGFAGKETDTSIMVHSCHSPMREVEVLYDNLLDMFNKDHALSPRDVIVMTPDIEIYSPYISAVFGDPYNEQTRIPFGIADRSIRNYSPALETFFAVLELKESRFEAGKVLEILECKDVLEKFEMTAGDLRLIREWIKATRINWGIDGSDREKLGLPNFDENTWKAGIERMLLGYAMPNEELLYQGILPYDIEGSESVILGKFIHYFDTLANIEESLSGAHTLIEWNNILIKILDYIINPDIDAENTGAIRDDINRLCHIEELSEYHEQVELMVIKTWLENYINEKRMKAGFLTGGVTFSAMLPMRSIPFKIICLIGMNDNAFPATDKTTGFNLITQNPQRGDRTRRGDDRYLFLESIISARKKLYLSYVGQSIQDNSIIPPSVAVSELLDYIENYAGKDTNIKDIIFTRHPLQSFSPRYFKGSPNLFSYSGVNCAAGRIMASERREAGTFFTSKLPDSSAPEEKVIQLKDFTAFFTNPAKYLLNKRLAIYLDDRADVLDENEPFDIEGLERYRLEETMCEHYIAGAGIEKLYDIARAAGALPHGAMGKAAFQNLIPGVKNFSDKINEIALGDKLPPLEINLEISGYNLCGRMDNIWPKAMIRYRYAKTKAKDRIVSWIAHLALNAYVAQAKSAAPSRSILVCKDASWEMEPAGNSMDILKDFMEIYIRGKNELISFFPEASLAYVDSLVKKGSREEALRQAEQKWTGNDFQAGEGRDQYFYLCLGKTNPFNDDFAGLAIKLLAPMLEGQKKV